MKNKLPGAVETFLTAVSAMRNDPNPERSDLGLAAQVLLHVHGAGAVERQNQVERERNRSEKSRWPRLVQTMPLEVLDMEDCLRIESDGIGAVCDLTDHEADQVGQALVKWAADRRRQSPS